MTERIVLPGLDEDTNATLNRLKTQLDQRAVRNTLRSAYYDGKRAIRQVGTVIPPQYYRLGIVLGWGAKAVDLLARRCTLDGFVWPEGDLDSLGAEEVWQGNHLAQEINSAVISSLLYGVAFLVNTRGEAGEPSSLIHVRDATQATGDWNHRRRGLDNLLSVTGHDADGNVSSLALYLDGVTITAERDGGRWQWDASEHPWGVPAEPLVYKYRTGRPFGCSRLSRPIMGLQDQAVRELIRAEGHMDIYSYPEMWMLGADMSVFKNADGSQRSAWQVMLGRIKGLPDDEDAENPRAQVQQFPASSPEPHLAWLNALAKLFAREASLPDTALAITDMANPTSAEAYDASQYELIAEAEGATDDWSRALRRSFTRALAIQNGLSAVPDEWRGVDVDWRNPRYLTRAAEADAGMKQLTAAPWLAETEIGLELLGLTDKQIKRAMAEKRRQAGRGVLEAIQSAAAGRAPTVTAEPDEVAPDASGEPASR